MNAPSYNANTWIRQKIGVRRETRPCVVADFNDTPTPSYFAQWLDSQEKNTQTFAKNFPNFQAYMDFHYMRRDNVVVSAYQVCATISFRNSDLADYNDKDEVVIPSLIVSKRAWGGTAPAGKYLIDDFLATDRHNCTTLLEITWVQTGEFTRRKIKNASPPSPTGTVVTKG